MTMFIVSGIANGRPVWVFLGPLLFFGTTLKKKVVPNENAIERACEISLVPLLPLLPLKKLIHTHKILRVFLTRVYCVCKCACTKKVGKVVPVVPDSEKSGTWQK